MPGPIIGYFFLTTGRKIFILIKEHCSRNLVQGYGDIKSTGEFKFKSIRSRINNWSVSDWTIVANICLVKNCNGKGNLPYFPALESVNSDPQQDGWLFKSFNGQVSYSNWVGMGLVAGLQICLPEEIKKFKHFQDMRMQILESWARNKLLEELTSSSSIIGEKSTI